jgi:chemotaxis family two-component system sensor kinase Cph1
MSDFQGTLNNFDVEPLQLPGLIQSHGYLIALDDISNICFCSENISEFIAIPHLEFLNNNLEWLEVAINHVDQQDFITQLLKSGKGKHGYAPNNPFKIEVSGSAYNLIISASDNYTLLEFEPCNTLSSVNIQHLIGTSLSEMVGDGNLKSLLENSVTGVNSIIDFDRVMIYRFAEDGNGEVVAESKNNNLESWLGLHYPESDNPKQARELYKKNLTRLVADVNVLPSRLSAGKNNTILLDLSSSELEAVGPMHIQYLKIMGAASSFSISILYKNEVWGLITCHNYTPKHIEYKSRTSAKLLGQILSSSLELRQDGVNLKIQKDYNQHLGKLAKLLLENKSIINALTQFKINILNVVKATGAVLVYDHKVTTLGVVPGEQQLKRLLKWVAAKRTKAFYFTNHLSDKFPEALSYKNLASGLMVLVLDREKKEYIIWFKPEIIKSPTLSFKIWEEIVKGKSSNWTTEEVDSVKRL